VFLGSNDSIANRVDIPFRVDLNFFVAARSGLASAHTPLTKKGEVLFEFIDSTGVSAGRVMEPIQQTVASSLPPPGTHQWYQGIASVSIPPGKFSIITELSDHESKRDFTDKQGDMRVPKRTSVPGLTTLFLGLGEVESHFPDTLVLQNYGGDFLFGSKGYLATTLLGLDDTVGISIDYTIAETGRVSEGKKFLRHVEKSAYYIRTSCLLRQFHDSIQVGYLVANGGKAIGIAVPLPLAELPLRDFDLSLTIQQGDRKAEANHHFRAVWPDMPASLRDIDVALDALRLLLPENSLNRLRKGSYESRRDSLESFWDARRGGSKTAYNPLMAEFYRRVDEASRSFSTLHEPDGVKTDRGKIYVLYGPPTSTERSLAPGKPFQEVWIYENINKRFVFEDAARNGNYVLLVSSPGL